MRADGPERCPSCGMRPKLEIKYEKPTLYRYRCPRVACAYHNAPARWVSSINTAADNWNERIETR